MRTKQGFLPARVHTGRMTNFPAFSLRNYARRVKDILGTELSVEGAPPDVATHAGRCSSIMRHFITPAQPLHINLVGGTGTLARRSERTLRFTLAGYHCFCGYISLALCKFTMLPFFPLMPNTKNASACKRITSGTITIDCCTCLGHFRASLLHQRMASL